MQTDEEMARRILGACTCEDEDKHFCAACQYGAAIAAALRRVREETLEEAALAVDAEVAYDLLRRFQHPSVADALRHAAKVIRASNAPKEGEK